ncbi:hypothetical protein FPV67DRAFT_1458626 [Lyophyllum atratum]|nr:hypothetical protein FPV67DRAFT_1458626 [Lyophyllum atratum]
MKRGQYAMRGVGDELDWNEARPIIVKHIGTSLGSASIHQQGGRSRRTVVRREAVESREAEVEDYGGVHMTNRCEKTRSKKATERRRGSLVEEGFLYGDAWTTSDERVLFPPRMPPAPLDDVWHRSKLGSEAEQRQPSRSIEQGELSIDDQLAIEIEGTTTTTTTSTTSTSSTTTTSSPTTTSTTSTTTTTSETTTSSPTTTTTSDTTSTTSSAPTTSTTTTPSTTSSPTSTAILTTTDGGGNVVTTTSVIAITPTLPPPTGTAAASTNKGFFQNTGAVAGTFAVVGLVALALLIFLISTIVRRRRAKRFDREIAEAAAEAAAAPAPIFLDDDDDDRHYGGGGMYSDHNSGGGGGGGGGGYTSGGQYSDVSSHGTFGQPALSTGHGSGAEAYGMREMGGPSPGEIFSPYGAAGGVGAGAGAGAAGVGVARARSTRDPGAFASGLQEGATPYPAFAGPGAYHPQQQQQHQYGNVAPGQGGGGYGNNRGPGSPEYDLLEAAGMGAGVGAGVQRGISLNHAQNQHQPPYSQQAAYGGYMPNPFANNTNNNSSTAGSHSPPPGSHTNSSGSAYTDLQRNQSSGYTHTTTPDPPKDNYASHYASGPPGVHAGEDEGEDAYGGYMKDGKAEDESSSVYDDEEEEEVRVPRVLKVANE